MKIASLLFTIALAEASSLAYREPKAAYGELRLNETDPGKIDQLGDLTVHRYGPASNSKWLLWGHDIYGVLSGRTMEYCLKMNQELGVTCILPDFFRGVDGRPDPVPAWDQLVVDWEEKLVPYLKSAGAQSVAVVGTCFGSYLGVHMSASRAATFMKGGIYFHPAHPGLMEKTGEDEAEVYRRISSPQAFMDTPDSAASVREGGLADDIIQTTFFEEFDSPCNHGFFNRGDLTDPAVADCVQRGLDNLVSFVKQYVVEN